MPTKAKEAASAAAKTVKTAVKATKAKAAAKKAPETSVRVQFGGNEYDLGAIRDTVMSAAAAAVDGADLASLDIYVKPEDGKAYFVANGGVDGSVDL